MTASTKSARCSNPRPHDARPGQKGGTVRCPKLASLRSRRLRPTHAGRRWALRCGGGAAADAGRRQRGGGRGGAGGGRGRAVDLNGAVAHVVVGAGLAQVGEDRRLDLFGTVGACSTCRSPAGTAAERLGSRAALAAAGRPPVRTGGTAGDGHELVKVGHPLVAAGPALQALVEDRAARVEGARVVRRVVLIVLLHASASATLVPGRAVSHPPASRLPPAPCSDARRTLPQPRRLHRTMPMVGFPVLSRHFPRATSSNRSWLLQLKSDSSVADHRFLRRSVP